MGAKIVILCSYCGKIREEKNVWRYGSDDIIDNPDVQFSHGICPNCYARHATWDDELLNEKYSSSK